MGGLNGVSDETIQLVKDAFNDPSSLKKAGITTALGVQGYLLERPSKKLYPALSPLRNMIPRVQAPIGAPAANWKAITGINTAGIQAAVAFGTRNTAITYTESDKAQTFKSFGLDDIVQDEAIWQSQQFEDVRALSAIALLQAVMIEEDKMLLGAIGTAANAFGNGPTPTTVSTASGGGTWGATTQVWVKCVALPLYGYLLGYPFSDLTAAVPARHSNLSAVGGSGGALAGTTDSVASYVTPKSGAYAYMWFVGQGASEPADTAKYLAAVTTVPYAKFLTNASSSNVAASTVTTDTSRDANAFEGLTTQLINVNGTLTTLDSSLASGVLKAQIAGTDQTGALVYDFNATTSPGTAFTSDGAGGIKELDLVLKTLWDRSRIGPSVMMVNSQEALSITRVVAGNTSGLIYRAQINPGDKQIVAGEFIQGYLNKFSGSMTPGNPDVIPIMINPYIAPGTAILLSERLPYPNAGVPNVFEVETQQEYTDYEWARVQRQYEHGIYAQEALKVYFPAGCAVLRSIAPS